jgi:hypothetical protein
MFMLVGRGCERASVFVTSNKPFSGWGKIFGDDVVAAATSTGASTTPKSSPSTTTPTAYAAANSRAA